MVRKIVLHKWHAFKTLSCLIILLGLLWQFGWIFSHVTIAKIVPFTYPEKYPSHSGRVQAVYYVQGKEYSDVYIRKSFNDRDSVFPLRYLNFAPQISRANTLLGNWGVIFTFWTVCFLILVIIFLRPDIFSKRDIIIIQNRKPYFEWRKNI